MRQDDYAPIASIPAFASRVSLAAGKSANLELVAKEERFGGNGPLLAGALAALGAGVSCAGCFGSGAGLRSVHPAFAAFAARCRRVVALGPPGVTHALEFGDGKVMCNIPGPIQQVTWNAVIEAFGSVEDVRVMMGDCPLWAFVNWSIMAGVEDIWKGLLRDVLPALRDKPRRIFIDLSDPAKRTDADLTRMLGLLSTFQRHAPVTLGLNASEAARMCSVLAVPFPPKTKSITRAKLGPAYEHAAASLQAASKLDCVMIHPREGAAAATANERAWFDGPATSTPTLSTGAGDHCNAGFAIGQAMGLPIEQCLAIATALSGVYVRDAQAPDQQRLVGFLSTLPEPEF